MLLTLYREPVESGCTIGRLMLNGQFFCNTLEKPAPIRAGRYEIIVNMSPRFKRNLPRLLNVPNHEGILIHRGNTVKDTAGCILVGRALNNTFITDSTNTEIRLTELLLEAQNTGDRNFIEIQEI